MTSFTRILIAIVALTELVLPNSTTASAEPAARTAPALTAAETDLVDRTYDRFAAAGMELPGHLTISFHDDADACAGNLGLRTDDDAGQWLRICWTHEDPDVQLRLQEQALVHELAHAWVHETVTEAKKLAFVELTGSGSWNLQSTDWHDRGTEKAADLITWALLDPAVLFVEFEDTSCSTWPIAFELLTGRAAPAHLAASC